MESKNSTSMFKLATLLVTLGPYGSTLSWAQESATANETPSAVQATSNETSKRSKNAPTVETNPALYGEGDQADNTSDMTPYENETEE